MRHTITARRQCLSIATIDALTWVEQNASETFSDLMRQLDGDFPASEDYATALRRFDTGFDGLSEAPSTSAGVPARWASVYNSEVERQYRRFLRRRIAEVEDASAAEESAAAVRATLPDDAARVVFDALCEVTP